MEVAANLWQAVEGDPELIPRQAKVIESYLPKTGKAIRRYRRWYRSQAKP